MKSGFNGGKFNWWPGKYKWNETALFVQDEMDEICFYSLKY